MNTANLLTSTQALAGLGIIILTVGIAWGTLKESVKHINDELNREIKPELKSVRDRIAIVEGKIDRLADSRSPLSLTDKGQKIIRQSGLKAYIDQNQAMLRQRFSQYGELKTPYDVQQAAQTMFDKYEFPEAVDTRLKICAFDKGVSFESICYIGSLYFRDIYLVAQAKQKKTGTSKL